MNEHEKQRRFLAYQAGWITGARSSKVVRVNPQADEDLGQDWARGYQKGKDTRILAMAQEADRLGLDAPMSLLVHGKKPC
jgi:hypothetical protein